LPPAQMALLADSLDLLGLAEKLSRSGGQKAFHPE